MRITKKNTLIKISPTGLIIKYVEHLNELIVVDKVDISIIIGKDSEQYLFSNNRFYEFKDLAIEAIRTNRNILIRLDKNKLVTLKMPY